MKMEKRVDEKEVKKMKNRLTKIINSAEKNIIIDYMKEWKKQGKIHNKPFVELSKMLKNRYTSKAICDYWSNILDPRLDRESFSQKEKEYIYKWVKEHQKTKCGNIPWKLIQYEIKENFNKFRSRNDLKNIWNSRKRQLFKAKRQVKDVLLISEEVNNTNEGELEYYYEDKNEYKYNSEVRSSTKHVQFLLDDINQPFL